MRAPAAPSPPWRAPPHQQQQQLSARRRPVLATRRAEARHPSRRVSPHPHQTQAPCRRRRRLRRWGGAPPRRTADLAPPTTGGSNPPPCSVAQRTARVRQVAPDRRCRVGQAVTRLTRGQEKHGGGQGAALHIGKLQQAPQIEEGGGGGITQPRPGESPRWPRMVPVKKQQQQQHRAAPRPSHPAPPASSPASMAARQRPG
jgi:hypothetical protein